MINLNEQNYKKINLFPVIIDHQIRKNSSIEAQTVKIISEKYGFLTKIKKIVSGSNKSAALYIKQIYDEIILAGTYVVSSIRVAEAAKIIAVSYTHLTLPTKRIV